MALSAAASSRARDVGRTTADTTLQGLVSATDTEPLSGVVRPIPPCSCLTTVLSCPQLRALVPLLPRSKSMALWLLTRCTLRQEVCLTKTDFQLLVRHILGEDLVILQSVTRGLAKRQRCMRSRLQQRLRHPDSIRAPRAFRRLAHIQRRRDGARTVTSAAQRRQSHALPPQTEVAMP